jgi:hypothetical protein
MQMDCYFLFSHSSLLRQQNVPNFVGIQETGEFDSVVEDCPDASTAFRSQGTDICDFFLLYGPWNDELDDR